MTITDRSVADILDEATRTHTASECGRLHYEFTEGEPALRDAVSAVLCIIGDCQANGDNADKTNEIMDRLVAGFVYQDLKEAASRHEDRNRDPDEA